MKLQDLLKDIELGKVYTDKDRKPFKVNEDGHTDVPSAIRKLKLSTFYFFQYSFFVFL